MSEQELVVNVVRSKISLCSRPSALKGCEYHKGMHLNSFLRFLKFFSLAFSNCRASLSLIFSNMVLAIVGTWIVHSKIVFRATFR